MACEKGESRWLTVLYLVDHGFALPKGAFRDTLRLQYGWQVPELSTTCLCGSPLEIEHALGCHFWGLPIKRHNKVRNLLASCVRKAGYERAIEPPLQRLSGEHFTRHSTTTDDEARLDIKAAVFFFGGGGMGGRKHFSTSGCSTRLLPRIVPLGDGAVSASWARRAGSLRRAGLWSEDGCNHSTCVLGDRRSRQANNHLHKAVGVIACKVNERALVRADGLAAGATIFQPPALCHSLPQKLEADISCRHRRAAFGSCSRAGLPTWVELSL